MASVESYTPCLLGAMDRLWFQKVVLISEPSSSNKTPVTKNSQTSPKPSKSHPSSNLPSPPTDCSDDLDVGIHELLPTTASTNPKKSDSEHEDDKKERLEDKEVIRHKRPTLTMKKKKASSVPIRRRNRTRIRLERTRSSKSSAELEEEELKGFMDLGFIFDKERITPKMMSMIPGLQRLEGQEEEDEEKDNNNNGNGEEDDVEIVGEVERRRPYLSEAWLIEREESPIVMMRMPMVNAASNDMKRHLKVWAKTVAFSAVQHA